MAYTYPSISDFQSQFSRDFPYGTDPNTTITTTDIQNAFNFVNFNINTALFPNQGDFTLGYLLLAAHFLVVNIRSSSQGINGQFNFLQQGKGVGAVNESFAIPDWILRNAMLSMYTKTNYGAMFLQLILPQLIGNMWNAYGTTLPVIFFLFFSYHSFLHMTHILQPFLFNIGSGGYL